MLQKSDLSHNRSNDADRLSGLTMTFTHPDDVVLSRVLSDADKRAVLATWASDAHAVPNMPAMRQPRQRRDRQHRHGAGLAGGRWTRADHRHCHPQADMALDPNPGSRRRCGGAVHHVGATTTMIRRPLPPPPCRLASNWNCVAGATRHGDSPPRDGGCRDPCTRYLCTIPRSIPVVPPCSLPGASAECRGAGVRSGL